MTEGEVADRLRHVFPPPAHVILEGVRNGTGYAKRTRTADAVILSVYPSRGLWIAGVEIKTHRGDWKRELANPDKAAAISQYCDYWYMAAPEGVIPVEEIPEEWGLIEVKANTAKIKVKSCISTEVSPPDKLFLCSVLRNFSDGVVPSRQVNDLVKKKCTEFATQVKYNAEAPFLELQRKVKEFEAASGVDISQTWSLGKIGSAVKLIVEAGSPHTALSRLSIEMNAVRNALNHIETVLNGQTE